VGSPYNSVEKRRGGGGGGDLGTGVRKKMCGGGQLEMWSMTSALGGARRIKSLGIDGPWDHTGKV